MRNNTGIPLNEVRPLHSAKVLALAVAALGSTGAFAFQIDTGNPDLTVTWGNTVRYNAGWRMDERSRRIANSNTSDEGTFSYDKGATVTNRFDLLTELDVDYRREIGFRVSAAAWKDFAFNEKVRFNSRLFPQSSYRGDHFSDTTERFHKEGGEILDAYVYKNFTLGDMSGDIKAGRHTVLWGEALILSPFSVSHNQAPTDAIKALNTPGVDAKEIMLPIGQVSANLQVTPTLSLAAQYYYEWRNSRAPQGGTYLGSTDFVLEGPHRAHIGPFTLAGRDFDEPEDRGDFGIAARWSPDWLGGTLGLYYRDFTEKSAVASLAVRPGGFYEYFFPENQKLIGLSLAKSIGGVSVGAEIVRREDTVLNSTITDGSRNVARGDAWTALLNGVTLFGPTAFWSSASLVAELGYSYLEKVTENEAYFNRCRGIRDEQAGCSSRDNSMIALRFTPSWTAVVPGWDASMNMAVTYGLDGNSPLALPDHGQEKAGSWSIGTTWTYNARHDFTLAYIDYLATNEDDPTSANPLSRWTNGSQRQDRGWLSFTYKGSF